MRFINDLAKKRKPDSATPPYFKLIAGIAVFSARRKRLKISIVTHAEYSSAIGVNNKNRKFFLQIRSF